MLTKRTCFLGCFHSQSPSLPGALALISALVDGASCSCIRYDLVDVSRQSLQLISTMLYNQTIAAFKAKNKDAFRLVQ